VSWSPEEDSHPLERLLRGPSEAQVAEARARWEQRAAKGDVLRLTLRAYSGREVACVKCGHAGATVNYVTGHRYPDHLGHSDGLLRNCEACGYGWFERCRDGDQSLEGMP
jgi:hypothetical protein